MSRDKMQKNPHGLLPCPFCANPRIQITPKTYPPKYHMRGYVVFCNACSAQVEGFARLDEPLEKAEAEAVAAWNSRRNIDEWHVTQTERRESVEADRRKQIADGRRKWIRTRNG